MRVLIFGDSITQGFWAVEHGWVDLIRKHYSQSQFATNKYHGIFNLGVDADNSTNILQRIENELVARTRLHHKTRPLVLLQIGINDSVTVPVEPQTTLDDYKSNLNKVINKVKALKSNIIFVGFTSCNEVMTTPTSWGDFNYTNSNIKKYEDAMKSVAAENNIEFIPVFDEFKKHIDEGEDLLPDGLHPNDAGHQIVYQIVMRKLQGLLK